MNHLNLRKSESSSDEHGDVEYLPDSGKHNLTDSDVKGTEEIPYLPDIKEKVASDIENCSSESSFLEDDILELPKVVRDIVPLEDDPSISILTFRYYVLSVIFVAPGAFISVMNSYRTTSAAYSIFFVQLASHWVGKWMARVLPDKKIGFGRYKISLNPGPWTIKETAMVTITASSGATGSLATSVLSLAEVFYGDKVHPAIAIFFMWAIVFVGYSYAAIARNFLLYDPQFVWPQALMQTTLFQTQAKSDGDSVLGKKQMRVFFAALLGMCAWEFLPEFVFPMLSSLAFLCWVAPRNETANFIGSGLGGMGFMNLTLDWSNITSSVMLYPYWVQVVQFIAFVLGAWVLLPAAKWGNLGGFQPGLMSNRLFTSSGQSYPSTKLLNADLTFNETAYKEYGPVHLGTQRLWNIFFDYAAYISGVVWVVVFGHDSLKKSFTNFVKNYKARRANKEKGKNININQQYTDRLNKLQAHYNEVPLYWYVLLFLASFVILITIFATGHMFMPWWCLIVGLAFGATIVTPLAWLYALSNFQLAIGTFNELIYGYMVQNIKARHPAGALAYGAVAGDAWYRAQYILQDQKIGHYMHLAPKAVFFSQIFGELIGVPINYGAMRWVLDTKSQFISGEKTDPLHQWTGQSLVSYQSNAVQYVILGPKRLFHNYPMLPYGFLVGAGCPVILYLLNRFFKKSPLKFRLWNTTVFFSTMSNFYGNVSTGPFSQFVGGTITMFWAFRYRNDLWKRYNYLLAAAFDTGFNLAILLIFLFFSAGKQVNMPNWWGNNEKSVERCFAN